MIIPSPLVGAGEDCKAVAPPSTRSLSFGERAGKERGSVSRSIIKYENLYQLLSPLPNANPLRVSDPRSGSGHCPVSPSKLTNSLTRNSQIVLRVAQYPDITAYNGIFSASRSAYRRVRKLKLN